MDHPSTDFSNARNMMVDGQVRPNKVTDPRILDAMRKLPRERFLPAHLASLAYADEDVALPGGRALMEPMVIARLVQMLAVRPGERVLVVGAGVGYGAALLEACGAQVTALEQDEALSAIARTILPEVAPGVAMVVGKLPEGWKIGAPFDAILIEGAVEHVPAAIVAQLKQPGGRLSTVRVTPGARGGQGVVGEVVSVQPGRDALGLQAVFDCSTPVLPQLIQEKEFVF